MTNTSIDVKPQSISEYLGSPAVQKNIESVLGERKAQFITSVASLVNSNEALQTVERKSLFAACLTAASLDLPINPSLGFAYIIPYKNNKTGETLAQFQMGYKGFIQLAMRSGQFKTINATDVREGELKTNNRLSGEIEFEWLEKDRESKPIIGYVAYMRLVNGFEKSLYMSMDEVKKHSQKYSQSMRRGYGLWKDEFDLMAKKTVTKLLLSKFAPLSTDMQTATLVDQAVVTEKGYEYVDNMTVDSQAVATEKESKRVMKRIEAAKTVEELDKVRDHLATQELEDAYQDKLNALLVIEAQEAA